MNPKYREGRRGAPADALALDARLQVLDDDDGLDDVSLAVEQQRELAQRPGVYASLLAFEWRPQTPKRVDDGSEMTGAKRREP